MQEKPPSPLHICPAARPTPLLSAAGAPERLLGRAQAAAPAHRGQPWHKGHPRVLLAHAASKPAHLQLNERKAHPGVIGFPRNPTGFPRNSGNAQIWYVLQ